MKDLTVVPMSHSRIRQSFRRGLKTYHTAATHQAKIAGRLVQQLAAAGAPKSLPNVLEFGCGTGHLTQCLQETFDITALTLNDLVPECQAFVGTGATFISGPVETLALPQNLDLICSASTVQWLEELPTTLARLAEALAPGGWLALSGFGSSQFHELRALGSTAAAPSYVDAENWHKMLPDDLAIRHLSQARRVEWFSDTRALLRHLRDTGVNGAASHGWSLSRLKEFERHYRTRFGTPQGLPLTYDPVWIIAQKT